MGGHGRNFIVHSLRSEMPTMKSKAGASRCQPMPAPAEYIGNQNLSKVRRPAPGEIGDSLAQQEQKFLRGIGGAAPTRAL